MKSPLDEHFGQIEIRFFCKCLNLKEIPRALLQAFTVCLYEPYPFRGVGHYARVSMHRYLQQNPYIAMTLQNFLSFI